MLIISLFLVLIAAGINVAIKAKDMYGRLLSTGIISVVAIQLIINVAVVTGSMPVTRNSNAFHKLWRYFYGVYYGSNGYTT